jgi:hypothetical protein
MRRMQEEIHQTYQLRPVLAPYNTLFYLLQKHGLMSLADKFMKARAPDDDYDYDDNDSVMMYDEYDEHGKYNSSVTMPHIRPGRKFLAGPGCKPVILKQCGDCKKIKEGIKT